MIKISQIDSKLSIYRENIVVIWGTGDKSNGIIDLLEHFQIKVYGVCDYTGEFNSETFRNIKVIKKDELSSLYKEETNEETNEKNVVVQIGDIEIYEENIYNEIVNLCGKSNVSVISYEEIKIILNLINELFLYNNSKELYLAVTEMMLNNAPKEELPTYELSDVYIVQPPKTGDYTVKKTLEELGINHIFTHHESYMFKELMEKNPNSKIKILTAVRDPIAQNLSMLYHKIIQYNKVLFNMIKDKDGFLDNGGDVQILFDDYFSKENFNPYPDTTLGAFFEDLKENLIDLRKYDFDKEKGFSIIKEGNLEIFMYQLEKLDNIVDEISNWIGKESFSHLINDNIAESKWIGNSYKDAKENIKFSLEYFENSYNNSWVQHFYSENDIKKFKKKWNKSIL